jgi:hypothetical protein
MSQKAKQYPQDNKLTEQEIEKYELNFSSYLGLFGNVSLSGESVNRIRELCLNLSPTLRDSVYHEVTCKLDCNYMYSTDNIPKEEYEGYTQQEFVEELHLNVMIIIFYYVLKILEYYLGDDFFIDFSKGFYVPEKKFLIFNKERFLSSDEVVKYIRKASEDSIDPWLTLADLIENAKQSAMDRILKGRKRKD